MKKRDAAYVTVGFLMLGMVMLAGCGGKNQNLTRALNSHEADQLLALQSARRQLPGEQQGENPALEPKHLEAQGDKMVMQGDWTGALFQYSRAVALVKPGERSRLRAKMAEISLRARMFVPAERLFRDLAKGDPSQAVTWQGLGLALLGQNRLQDAEEALNKAVGLDPRLWKAHNALGVILNRRQQPKQALQALAEAIRIRPQEAALYNNQALAYMLAADLKKAESSLRKALLLSPHYRLAANNLGLVLAKAGREAEALRAFKQAAGQAQAHNNLGVVLAWQGQHNRAAAEFRRAIQRMPRYYPLAGRHLEQIGSELSGPEAPPPAVVSLPRPYPSGGTVKMPVASPGIREKSLAPQKPKQKTPVASTRGAKPFPKPEPVMAVSAEDRLINGLLGDVEVPVMVKETNSSPVMIQDPEFQTGAEMRPVLENPISTPQSLGPNPENLERPAVFDTSQAEEDWRAEIPAAQVSLVLHHTEEGKVRQFQAAPVKDSRVWRGSITGLPSK
ncbi:MAG: tetratricopeptide repeat protein [Desulfarculaceae bacterium]